MHDIAGVWAGKAINDQRFLYVDLNPDGTGLIALYYKDSPDSPELLIQNYDCTWSTNLNYRNIDIVINGGDFTLSGYASLSWLQLKWHSDTHEHIYSLHRRQEYMEALKEIEDSLAFPDATVGIAYIVEEGDNVYTVAIEFGVTANTLRIHNVLTSSELTPGQTLFIPLQQEDSLTFPNATIEREYIVKEGDDIYTIAIKFGVNATTLRQHNKLTTNELTSGQTIIIPLSQ